MEHSPPPLPADFGRQSVAAQLDYHQPPVRSSKWAWASLAVAAGTLVLGFGISAAVQFWALPALRRPLMTLSGAWILFGPVLGVTFAGIGLRRNMGLRALALAALLLNLAPWALMVVIIVLALTFRGLGPPPKAPAVKAAPVQSRG